MFYKCSEQSGYSKYLAYVTEQTTAFMCMVCLMVRDFKRTLGKSQTLKIMQCALFACRRSLLSSVFLFSVYEKSKAPVKRARLFEYNRQHLSDIRLHIVACCWVFGWSNALNILPRHLFQTRRELQKTKEMYCYTTFVDATFLIPIKLPSTTCNMLRHVSTCVNKVVKRSRLFPLDKCCMLYREKSSSFDQGLTAVSYDCKCN